jgi:hypothetical protein
VVERSVFSDEAGWGDWGVRVVHAAPHPAFGHLLPPRGAGEGDGAAISLHDHMRRSTSQGLLPPLLAGEGARRADEGQRDDS